MIIYLYKDANKKGETPRMNNITVNIVEPGSGPTPAPVVPNTGLFTHGIGTPEATIITVGIVAIIAIVAAVLYYKKKHSKDNTVNKADKAGKATKLAKTISTLKTKKKVSIPLAALALVVSLGTLTALLVSAGKSNTNAAEGGLTVTESSEGLTIEVADTPVFAVLPVELTVAESTEAGYTLTAYTDNTDLVSTTDGSKVIPMVAADEGELAALADNTYGLALDNKPASKDNEVYTTLSTDANNPTFITDKDYEGTGENDKTTIYYGFYITPDTPKGTYEGSVINYEAEPNYITDLSFDGNGSDGGTAIEGMTLIAGDTITLPANTYTKEGYNFTGWNTAADGTGEAYADEAEFTASTSETQDITLYAQWEKEILYMQDVATWGSTLSVGDEVVAVDNRDDKEYYVARLADGNIWMTQNLDLELSTSTELTPANTNISANWTPANSTISFTGTSISGWESNNFVPYSADPGDVYYYTSNTSDDDIKYNSLTECEAAGHTDCAHYHAGNYYNWPAAVASNDTSSMTEQFSDAEDSVCPAGWKLPNGPQNSGDLFEDNEFDTLITSQDGIAGERPTYCSGPCPFYNYQDGGLNKIRTAPLWLARSGGVDGGSLYDTGNNGYYWSSTVGGSNFAYLLNFNSRNVNPAYNYSRRNGYSIRCVAE